MSTRTTGGANVVHDELGRLRVVRTERLGDTTKYVAEFEYRDVRGQSMTGTGKFFVPDAASGPSPLWYQAGYEAADEVLVAVADRGCVVVNPVTPAIATMWPGPNPLGRSVNLDVALLHAARSLDVVDVARVVIGGGSAGGWMALMLAAETFPLAGVLAHVPVLNLGYNVSYWRHNRQPGATPALTDVDPLMEWAIAVLGDDTSAPTWFAHSPLSHVEEITAPVHGYFSTADMLVPVDQVARSLVRQPDPALFSWGYSTEPAGLPAGEAGAVRLADVVDDIEVHLVEVPAGAQLAGGVVEDPESSVTESPVTVDLPAGNRRWTVCVLDEGAPTPRNYHFRHAVGVNRDSFIERLWRWEPDPGQATEAKLRVLARRYTGQEWIDTPVPHLDVPEAERSDVERAMRAFRRTPGADEILAKLPEELIAQLP